MNTSRRGARSPRASVVVIQPRFVMQAVAWAVLGVAAVLVVGRSQHVLGLVLVTIVISLVLRAPRCDACSFQRASVG